MKPNKKLKETFDKLVSLKIPRKKRREFIRMSFFCGFKKGLEYQTINNSLNEIIEHNKALDEQSEKKVYGQKAVDRIYIAFRDNSNRYSEENYQSPWVNRLGGKLP